MSYMLHLVITVFLVFWPNLSDPLVSFSSKQSKHYWSTWNGPRLWLALDNNKNECINLQCFKVTNSFHLVQHFFHPQYDVLILVPHYGRSVRRPELGKKTEDTTSSDHYAWWLVSWTTQNLPRALNCNETLGSLLCYSYVFSMFSHDLLVKITS